MECTALIPRAGIQTQQIRQFAPLFHCCGIFANFQFSAILLALTFGIEMAAQVTVLVLSAFEHRGAALYKPNGLPTVGHVVLPGICVRVTRMDTFMPCAYCD